MQDSIRPTLEESFKAEKLTRAIQDCDDIDDLREMAFNLLELLKKKTAVLNWVSKRALDAGNHSKQVKNSDSCEI